MINEDSLIARGWEMAIAPPLRFYKHYFSRPRGDLLWVNLFHGYSQLLDAICELRGECLVDLLERSDELGLYRGQGVPHKHQYPL